MHIPVGGSGLPTLHSVRNKTKVVYYIFKYHMHYIHGLYKCSCNLGDFISRHSLNSQKLPCRPCISSTNSLGTKLVYC